MNLPIMADIENTDECVSPLTNEIHTYDPGLDKARCPEPVADFCAFPREGCDSLLVSFTDLSTGYIDTWNWDFGDPASGADNYSNDENPTHLYRSTGKYTITLTVIGPGGTDTAIKEHFIIVKTVPIADFEFSLHDGCQSTTVSFTDRSIGADTWYWTFGDGNYSSDQNPTHTYASAGTYTVTLKAYNECGRDLKERKVIISVGADPVADFSSDARSGCEGSVISFVDRSTYATSWSWDFGDGATSIEQNPTHNYSTAGKYTVTLTVVNECGEDTAVKNEYITILSRPVADFTSETTETCTGGLVQFTDLSLYAVAWWWDFGDGAGSIEQNPAHSYSMPGKYTVTLKAYNECGRDMRVRELYITVYPSPEADFTSDITEGCAETTVNFTDRSRYADSWKWDFGDGATSDEQNPSHTYSTAGIYTVSLLIANSCGEDEAVKTEYITIFPKPTADFSADITEGCVNGTVSFTDLSQYADSWSWDFGDGTGTDDRNPSHVYSAAGTYTIELTVTNECGDDEEIKTEYITIYPEPVANFAADIREKCEGESVSFTDMSSNAFSWQWDFGDGISSPDQNPSHTYMKAGIYTITLTVGNPCGQDDTVMVDYITILSRPTADFTADNLEGCSGTVVSFTNLSTEADSYKWEFGDGAESLEENPSHTYSSEGYFTVRLIAYNSCGSDEETKEEYISIYAGPGAGFESRQDAGCTGILVTFTDKSLYATSWSWDFGDGWTSVEQNPGHLYTSDGVFTVTLTVTNECGRDSISHDETIVLMPLPTADFTSEVNEGCEGVEIAFTNLSLMADSWYWDFGDGTNSSNENPSHVYNTAGLYTVSLTAYNNCGEDTEIKTDYITVHAGPTADFEAAPRTGESPLTVDFSDLSTSLLGIKSWLWDFGDFVTSIEKNPSHTYTAPGIYTVTLTVTDDCGKDTRSREEYIYVIDTCKIDFTFEPASGCAGLTAAFNGISNGPCEISSWTWDFGDPASGGANAASGKIAQHMYNIPGKYTVKLTAVDAGGTKVITKNECVTVFGPPTAAFSASPTEGVAPLVVQFNDLSNGNGRTLSWKWDFGNPAGGDDNSSDLQNPSHLFNSEGVYNVTLIASNDCGADTASAEIIVSPAITISKAVDKAITFEQDTLLYTLTIENNGEYAIGNLLVIDSIPDSTAYVTGSATGGGMYNVLENQMTWNIMGVAAGATVQVSFKVVLDGPFTIYPTTVSNKAYAIIIEDVAKPASSRTFVSNTVQTTVDKVTQLLEISKAVSATLALPGDILTYTITVTNRNFVAANNVMIYDAVPDSTAYVTGSISAGGTYYPATDSLVWNVGTLNPFESRSVSFQVTIDPGVPDGLKIPNTALVRSSQGDNQSNQVLTAVSLTPIVVTKITNRPSAMTGNLVRFTITIENYSGDLFEDVQLTDTLPGGIFYVAGTGILNGGALGDPSGDNPLVWSLGDLPASATLTVEYTVLIGASAHPGFNDNIAHAQAYQGDQLIHSNRAMARIYVLSHTLSGSIRGKVIVDCDGDGIADMDSGPVGMDVYLDDGSQSKVNEAGLFYFSTVRPGERVVALDERDLDGYYVPEDAQSSVFVHVHESGESYVIFRVCPDYPRLDIHKQAAIVPAVKVTKTAQIDPDQKKDTLGVLVDYEIDIKSNGQIDPTLIRIVDSFPSNTDFILDNNQTLTPKKDGSALVYEITAAQERMQQSAYYSLRDLAPGLRRFLTNKVHIEGALPIEADRTKTVVSDPVEVAVGPLMLAPPRDVQITLTPALFITSKADLQAPAIPQLEAAADSIMKYADAEIKVDGHTDYRRIHTRLFPSNWELGEARAKAVVDWLVDKRNIERDRLAYESFAATRPVVTTGHTSEQLQPNRRTEVIIRAKTEGFLAPDASPAQKWQNSTILTLDPIKYDTLFEPGAGPIEIGLDDSWEVILTIENKSAIAAVNSILTDILPEGAVYVENSAAIDRRVITAEVNGGKLSILIEKIAPSQKLKLHYRIRSPEGKTPTGGGAASVEVTTTNNLSVIQKSNEVRFK